MTATRADIDARLLAEATTPRIPPRLGHRRRAGSSAPARSSRPPSRSRPPRPRPTRALKDLQGGAAWEDVAKTVSTDATAPPGRRPRLLQADDTQADEAFLKAVFAGPK